MRIILKSFDGLKTLLETLNTDDRTALNDWFFNASDEELKQAILILNSKESLENYPRHKLKEYVKFAKALLLGALPAPPSDLDLVEVAEINYFNFAKGSYKILFALNSAVQVRTKAIFKRLSILGLTQTQVLPTYRLMQVTRPIASFCRVLMSRVSVLYKICFNQFLKTKSGLLRHRLYMTHLQKKKLILKSIHEMIKKGKVNLEQRAFWLWQVLTTESKSGRIPSLKEDFTLLRQLFHTGNLRYFQRVKYSIDKWKSVMPITIHSLLTISPDTMHRPSSKAYLKHHFRKKLKSKFLPLLSMIYRPLSHSFTRISQYAIQKQQEYETALRLASMMPHIRNLIHIHSKLLKDCFNKWNESQYEYQYEETVVSLFLEKKNFAVSNKPIVLLDYHEGCRVNKCLIRNLTHIIIRKLRFYWNLWTKVKKVDLNFSAEVTLDLSLFKLPAYKMEKLGLVFLQLKEIFEVKRNLPKVMLSKWIQAATKRLVTVFRVQCILNRMEREREAKKTALTAFKLNSKNYTEFTDIF